MPIATVKIGNECLSFGGLFTSANDDGEVLASGKKEKSSWRGKLF